MKVAVDLDGVIANFDKRFLEFTNVHFDRENDPKDIDKWEYWHCEKIDFSEDDFFKGLELFTSYKVWQSIEPYPNAVDAICCLNSMADIYYVTARPKNSERTTLKFLINNGFPMGRGILFCYDSKDKANIAKNLKIDIAIDDKIETIYDYDQSGIKTILRSHKHNKPQKKVQHLIGEIEDIKDFPKIVKKYLKKS